jgi:alkylated DNA repair dioxygenase AlkB
MGQQELFSPAQISEVATFHIPGFILRPDYVSVEQETELISKVDQQPWQTDYRRRIQQYGFGYSADPKSAPIWLRDFPEWLLPLAGRVSREAFDRPAENCVINEYVPPLGIGSHRDYPAFGPVVACVSLGSDIVMDFIEAEQSLRVGMHVPARSFWMISGDARTKWRHGIASRLTDIIVGERRPRGRRISITFRTLTDEVAR